MESASWPDSPAAYAIRVSGPVGPLVLASLRRAGLSNVEDAPPLSTMNFVVTGSDLMELAQRFTRQGLKIESLRAIGDFDD